MRLLRQADVDPADDGGVLRKDLDQSLFLKAHQGVADRRRTDAKLLGQGGPRQRRSRRQRQRGDQLAQPLEYLGRGLPVAVEPVGGAVRRAAQDDRRWTILMARSNFRKSRLDLICTNVLVHRQPAVNRPALQVKMRVNRKIRALCAGAMALLGIGVCAAGMGAAKDRDLAVAAARHLLHADPHHREAEADRKTRGAARRAQMSPPNGSPSPAAARRPTRCWPAASIS